MKIVFLGSADFGLPALKRLIADGHEIVGVVSTPAKPKGRGLKLTDSPVTVFAKEHGLTPIFTPENLKDEELVSSLKHLNADLFVVIAYRILPEQLFNLPPLGTVNAHASLLPLFRGPAPIHRAIEAGENITGVTVFRIDRGVDTGNIITRSNIEILPEDTTPTLYEKLSLSAAEQISDAVELLKNSDVKYIEQDHAVATKAPKLSKAEAKIDWDVSAKLIHNRVRAFKPFPGTYVEIGKKRLGINKTEFIENSSSSDTGVVVEVGKEYFDVSCKGSIIRILEVKPQGKKVMPVGAFLNGARIMVGDKL